MLTSETHAKSEVDLTEGVRVFEKAGIGGPLDGQPVRFLSAVVRGVAYATMDTTQRDLSNAERYRKAGFDALWAMLQLCWPKGAGADAAADGDIRIDIYSSSRDDAGRALRPERPWVRTATPDFGRRSRGYLHVFDHPGALIASARRLSFVMHGGHL